MQQLAQWIFGSRETAACNARGAALELSRGRVERAEVEAYLVERYGATRRIPTTG
ncbi:hypothetical protein NODU109028_20325 [Nocardioides dubius]|uniref:Uncharacterized protein n=1 Tax=Nocardioides dubius TaxID=317019 RepID=A0ABN1TNV1_9ACTN